ncbi:MAG: rhodanese-like domain-containing protein [Bacteroidota bacterium]
MKYISLCIAVFIAVSVPAQNNYKEVTLVQLGQRYQHDTKGYIILDVRTPGEYNDTIAGGHRGGIGHIKTAINLSLQDLHGKPETIHQLDQYKQTDVYVICSHSYRSRDISNLLLQNGFTSVSNVKGGMTEWYRNYEELAPYRKGMLETSVGYQNLAPSQFLQKLSSNEPVEVICLRSNPLFFFDSLLMNYYPFFPQINNTSFYKFSDSLRILEKAKALKGRPIVIFSTIGGGTLTTAAWLAEKGIRNVYNLVGGLDGFYEYLSNFQGSKEKATYLTAQSEIQFYTPFSFCKEKPGNAQLIDLSHDTTFNQVTHGTKLDYKTLKGAINFPYYKTAGDFEKQFPDKSRLYMLLPYDGHSGTEFAVALLKKGYRIGWIIGGLERWEWYTNNVVAFTCGDQFIK